MMRGGYNIALLATVFVLGACASGKTPPGKSKMVRIDDAALLTFTFGIEKFCENGEEQSESKFCQDKSETFLKNTLNSGKHPASAPTVPVQLNAFEMDEHEVTNLQYLHCVELGDCTEPKFGNAGDITKYYNRSDGKYDDYPVVSVTWDQAKTYCKAHGKRLPTEYEWELVATFGGTTNGPWGDELSDCNGKSVAIKGCNLTLVTEGAYGPRRIKTSTDDVVSFGGQEIFDMGGNVSEWVEDIYDRFQTCKNEVNENKCGQDDTQCHSMCSGSADVCNGYSESDTPLVNPTSKSGSGERCFRGGSYAHVVKVTNTAEAPMCTARSKDRSQKQSQEKTHTYLGFRCARTL